MSSNLIIRTMQQVAGTRYPHKISDSSSTLDAAIMVCSSMVEHSAVNRRVAGSSPVKPVVVIYI